MSNTNPRNIEQAAYAAAYTRLRLQEELGQDGLRLAGLIKGIGDAAAQTELAALDRGRKVLETAALVKHPKKAAYRRYKLAGGGAELPPIQARPQGQVIAPVPRPQLGRACGSFAPVPSIIRTENNP